MRLPSHNPCNECAAFLFAGHQGDHALRAARSIDDFEGRSDDDCTCRRELVKVSQARQAEFARAMHQRVTGEGHIKTTGLSRICADGLHAYTQDITLVGEEADAILMPTGGVWAIGLDVQEGFPSHAL